MIPAKHSHLTNRSTFDVVDDPDQLAEAHGRDLAMNRVYELVGANVRTTTTGVRRTRLQRPVANLGQERMDFLRFH